MTADSRTITLELLEHLFGGHTSDVNVRLWDGSHWPDDGPRRATVVLNHAGALREMLLPGDEALNHAGALREMLLPGDEAGLGEAYLYDDVDLEGDVEAVFDLAAALTESTTGWWRRIGRPRAAAPAPSCERRPPPGPAGPSAATGAAALCRARSAGRRLSL